MACDIYLQLEGIKGDSTDSAHKEWIEISSFSTGISQLGGGSSSAQGSHGYGKCEHSDFSVTKSLDSASPNLAKYACTGKHIPKMEVHLCRPTGDKLQFMKYFLEDVFITSYQTGGGAGGTPSESVSFRYGQIKYAYTPSDTEGNPLPEITAGWSTVENKEAA